jgi:hypothetical protein
MRSKGLSPGQYNQIANLAITQSEINIAIGDKAPQNYFSQLKEQCSGGVPRYGNISSIDELKLNMRAHAIPMEMLDGELPYNDFLEMRRKAMALKIKAYFERLSSSPALIVE